MILECMTHSPYISKVIYGRQVQGFRKRAGMSVAAAGRKMGISESKVRKQEAGTNEALKLPDAFAASVIYKLTGEETEHLIELVEAADSHGWYHDYDVSPEFAHYIEMEGAASTLHIVGQGLVFGLFQTKDYVDGLKTNLIPGKGVPDSGLRVERQETVLNGANPPEIVYITDEAALRREVGGPEVMQAQVRRLLEMSESENIEILVVPFASGMYSSIPGPYRTMYFTDGVFPTTVYLESLHGSHYEDADKVVQHYEEAFQETRQPPIAAPIKEFIDASNLLA